MSEMGTVESLEQELAPWETYSRADVRRQIDLLNDLAWELSDTDLNRARALGETACQFAQSYGDGGRPYERGMAYGLRTQGYVNQRLGDYGAGLSQLLRAQTLFEALSVGDGLADVFDGIAGIYYHIGDFAESLSYMHRQLDLAQRIGDRRRVANAYNNLAAIHSEMGDYDRAAGMFHQNLVIAAEINHKRIETISHLNLAELCHSLGDYGEASSHAQQGLRIAQDVGYELFEVHARDILGRLSLTLGDPISAIGYLEDALALSDAMDSKGTSSLVLSHMGEAYRLMGQLDRAVACLEKSVATAEAIEARAELLEALLRLSEVYEQQGSLAQAFAHFKQYEAVKERVLKEKADQRLQVLQVAYDTEGAKKEAEILQKANERLEQEVRSRTVELSDTVALLQSEIAERERAEAEIRQLVATLEQRVAARTDELATFFDLTLLAGQAGQLSEAFAQVLPRILDVMRSQAISICLFDADNTTLRLAGQLNLPTQWPTTLPLGAVSERFRRWMSHPDDPLLTLSLAAETSLPLAFRQPGFESYLGAQIQLGARVEGVLSCYRVSDRGFGLDEVALGTALAEQIGMMLATQRLRENAQTMAVVEERQRLARDLHDSVTQSLYSLSLFARAGREAAEDGDGERLKLSLAELERNSLLALREMRLLLYELRPADLQQEGLIRAIRLRLDTVERRAGLKVVVHLEELPGLSSDYQAELYHIIVEALNNVVRHAAATTVTVQMTARGGQVQVRISDDGQGFDPEQITGGMGLNNIRERVTRLNGQLKVTSAPGQGARLEAVIPCLNDHNQ
ncbi:MAG: tetratricopeptide repeat protein [Anaerolineae bacterium]